MAKARPSSSQPIQRLTGDYPAAAASLRMGQALHRDLGDRYKQA